MVSEIYRSGFNDSFYYQPKIIRLKPPSPSRDSNQSDVKALYRLYRYLIRKEHPAGNNSPLYYIIFGLKFPIPRKVNTMENHTNMKVWRIMVKILRAILSFFLKVERIIAEYSELEYENIEECESYYPSIPREIQEIQEIDETSTDISQNKLPKILYTNIDKVGDSHAKPFDFRLIIRIYVRNIEIVISTNSSSFYDILNKDDVKSQISEMFERDWNIMIQILNSEFSLNIEKPKIETTSNSSDDDDGERKENWRDYIL